MGADFHENAKNGNFISNEKDLFLKVAKEIDILYKCVIFPMERTDNMTAYPQMTAEERKAEYARLQKDSAAVFDDFQPDAEAGRLRVRRRRRAQLRRD